MGPTTPSESATAAPLPAVIPIEKIAPQAAEVAHLLGTYAEHYLPSEEVERIRTALPSASADLSLDLERTQDLLADQPSLETLQTQDRAWQERQLKLTAWLDLLSARAARLQDALDRLEGLQQSWALTRDAEQSAPVPATIRQRIEATLGAIAAAQPRVRAQSGEVLELQGRIAGEVIRCETVRAQIARLQQGAVGGILARASRPIWSPALWTQAQAALPARWSQILAAYGADMRAYLTDPAKHLGFHLGLFLLAVIALRAARGRVERWAAAGEDVTRVAAVFDRPIAAASLFALVAATWVAAPTPSTTKQLLGALALVPIVLLARPVVDRVDVPALFTVGILFGLDTLRHAFGGIPSLVDQAIILLESLAGGALLTWRLLQDGPRGTPQAAAGLGRPRLRRFLLGVLLAALALGGLASALGYLRLARLTTPAVLVGAADALWLYAAVEVATAAMAFALRVRPLRSAFVVRNHLGMLEARLRRVLVGVAVVSWCVRYLDYLGLWEPALAHAGALLATTWALGSFSTSVGDLLAFFVTLAVAYLLSAMIRFLLEEEVYPRAGVATGLSYAASSVVHYAIVAMAFFVALDLLGVTLTQVTVLAGALGIGIGFGLQGVVNNFVSGLILLFERPIKVGDAVQVGDLQGTVRRIGIRASVVRTLQGAEVIIPNAQLTTQQVTNWTLSDQQRRLDLPVGVNYETAFLDSLFSGRSIKFRCLPTRNRRLTLRFLDSLYGAAPNAVIALLEGVGRAHPKVLRTPPPRCLFLSYGDSSIDFELRVWTEYPNSIDVHNDLALAVYEAVYAAGLSFPFPQREVRLLSDNAPAAPVAAEPGPDKRFSTNEGGGDR